MCWISVSMNDLYSRDSSKEMAVRSSELFGVHSYNGRNCWTATRAIQGYRLSPPLTASELAASVGMHIIVQLLACPYGEPSLNLGFVVGRHASLIIPSNDGY